LSEQGVAASPDKIEAVKKLSGPAEREGRKGIYRPCLFLSQANARVCGSGQPANSVNEKEPSICLGIAQQEAFKALNAKLCTAPVLAFANFNRPFILTTDASKVAVAAILSQVQDGI
jgi:hypothetical protein